MSCQWTINLRKVEIIIQKSLSQHPFLGEDFEIQVGPVGHSLKHTEKFLLNSIHKFLHSLCGMRIRKLQNFYYSVPF